MLAIRKCRKNRLDLLFKQLVGSGFLWCGRLFVFDKFAERTVFIFSVTANTGLILCISLVCMQCVMTRRQYAGKACLLLSAICLLFVFTRDGSLSLWESAAILAVFVFYMAESLLAGRREQGAEQPAEKPKKDGRTVAWNIGKFVLGAAAIVLGAQLLIDNGSELARRIGVPDAVIAATMIAIIMECR